MRRRFIEMFLLKLEKAKSLDDFVDLVGKHGCTSVEITSVHSMMTGAFEQVFLKQSSVSTVYYICCTADMPGRRIVYHHQESIRRVPPQKHATDHELHEQEMVKETRWCAAVLRHRLPAKVKILGHHHAEKKRGVPLSVVHP